MALSIHGIGTASALGCGLPSLAAGLSGEIVPELERKSVKVMGREMELPCYRARLEGLERFIEAPRLRKLDRYKRMALLASFLALEDGGQTAPCGSRHGIVFGSAFGLQGISHRLHDGIIDEGDEFFSPVLFSMSLHSSLAGQVSVTMGINGPSRTVSTFEQTLGGVLLTAWEWLEEGAADYVLAGVGDEILAMFLYTLARMGEGGTGPFRVKGDGVFPSPPGESFVSFLLGRGENAGRYGAIDEVFCGAGLPEGRTFDGDDAFFLADNGSRILPARYEPLLAREAPSRIYAPLYGSNIAGGALDVAAAALSLERGLLYPSPLSGGRPSGEEPVPLPEAKKSICCAGASETAGCTFVSLSRP